MKLKQPQRVYQSRKVQELIDNGEFYQAFKEDIIPILIKLPHETEREGTLPKPFYESNITFIPKLDKDTAKRENYWQTSSMN
jgi:hypothetical protein